MTERQRIDQLVRDASRLPECGTKVSLLEEAVRLSDLIGDVKRGCRVRLNLTRAATFAGRYDVLLVAFAWCLSQFDRDPSQFSEWELLWCYKWVVGSLPYFPEVSREQIEALLSDMERRYNAAGFSRHAMLQRRRDVMVRLRDEAKARDAHDQLQRVSRDAMSDCPTCVACNDGRYYEFLKSWDLAWESYEPIVAGRLKCQEEPLRSTSYSLLVLLQRGEYEQAVDMHRRVVRRLNPNVDITYTAAHITFLAIVNELALAKRIMERHLESGLRAVSASERFYFHCAAILVVTRLIEMGTETVKIRLPPQYPSGDKNGERPLNELKTWFEAQARQIATSFDTRNRNRAYTREIDQLPELLTLGRKSSRRRTK